MTGKENTYVWFNGPSAVDLYHTPPCFEIGCNFISERRSVDHVCAYDGEVMNRLRVTQGVQYWTRRNYTNDTWRMVDTDYKYSCSGTMALQLAVNLGRRDVYLLGCDWTHTDASVFDEQYEWRKQLPKKVNDVRIKMVERLAPMVGLTHVTDRPPIFAGVGTMSTRNFLDVMC